LSTTIFVPVKPLAEAKSRLTCILEPAARKRLVLEMLTHVLDVTRRSRADEVRLVTRDPQLLDVFDGPHEDDPHGDLNLAVGGAFQSCWRSGITAVYLPADLPLLTREEVDGLLELGSKECIVLAPSRDERGTNAILAPPYCPLLPRLGLDSFRRHLHDAERLGYATKIFRTPGLELDVDTEADLAAMER
jgi:2-phospho-L-lactate guanylyltransferase